MSLRAAIQPRPKNSGKPSSHQYSNSMAYRGGTVGGNEGGNEAGGAGSTADVLLFLSVEISSRWRKTFPRSESTPKNAPRANAPNSAKISGVCNARSK